MNDRLTKEQLKEDVLVKDVAKAADFASKNGKAIVGAAVVVLAVAVGGFMFRANAAKSEDKAAGILTNATIEYRNGNYAAAAGQLDDLHRTMGGTRAGKRGLLLYGDLLYAQGSYQQAFEYYERALKEFSGDPIVSTTARGGLAATLESLQQNQRAAEEYGRLAADAPNAVMKAEYQLSQARNLELSGNSDQAADVYRDLERSKENYRAAEEAKRRLAQLITGS